MWRTIKNFTIKHYLLACLIITFIFTFIVLLPLEKIYKLITNGGEYTTYAYYYGSFFIRLFGFLIGVLLLVKLGFSKLFHFTRVKGKELIALIWPLVLLIFLVMPSDAMLKGTYRMDATLLFPMIARYIGVGMVEEIFFRGAVLFILLTALCHSRKGMYQTVLISALFFGLVHLANLIHDPKILIGTVFQVLYALFLGIFFVAFYLRTQNIWLTILLHAMTDIAGGLSEISTNTPTAATPSSSITDGFTAMLIMFPLAVYGLFILRKVNWKNYVIIWEIRPPAAF
jgi:CAAX amino terminal protease family.